MRPARSLVVLSERGRRRLRRLRHRAASVLSPGGMPNEEAMAWVVIEALNLWGNFVRCYLLSLLVSPMRRSGARAVIGNAAINCPGALLHAAVMVAKGPYVAAPSSRRDEPAWHDVSTFVKTCAHIQVSNLAQVQAAMSIQARALQDLPVFRNFYAHRNEESAAKAVKLGRSMYLITGVRHPSHILARNANMCPQQLLLDWLDDIEAYMDLLCD